MLLSQAPQTEQAPRVVLVTGAVDKPGVYAWDQETTAVGAMIKAGAPKGTTKPDVSIMRSIPGTGRRVEIQVNVKDIQSGKQPDVPLQPFDAIYVRLPKEPAQ